MNNYESSQLILILLATNYFNLETCKQVIISFVNNFLKDSALFVNMISKLMVNATLNDILVVLIHFDMIITSFIVIFVILVVFIILINTFVIIYATQFTTIII